MPDVVNRKKRERELAAALLLLFDDYADQTRIDHTKLKQDLEPVLRDHLSGTYASGFEQLRDGLNLEGLADPNNTWVTQYSKKLADMIVENTQKVAAQQAAEGIAIDLSSQFSAERAERIAITETTRANTAGEYGAVKTAMGQGILNADDMSMLWHTCEDELVCDECAPLNQQPAEVWQVECPGGPPLHVNCRCWLDYDLEVEESWTDDACAKSAETRRSKRVVPKKREKLVDGPDDKQPAE